MEDIGRRGAFVGFGNTAPGTRADVFGLAQRRVKGTVAAGGSGNFSPRTGTGYVFLTQMLLRCRRYRLCTGTAEKSADTAMLPMPPTHRPASFTIMSTPPVRPSCFVAFRHAQHALFGRHTQRTASGESIEPRQV